MVLGKHFINDVSSPVEKALKSLLYQNTSLSLIESHKVVYKETTPVKDKVVLITGGGSGHEPAHAGYIGEGMIDIVVAGGIFASPSAAQILVGLRAVDAPSGTLMIVKNYTGDVLNFGLAAQKARALGQNVEVVIVGDDVSLDGKSLVGRRGLAGTVFVHKCAGAAAANGKGLKEVAEVAKKVAENLMTVGVSLNPCSVPGRESQDGLPDDEIEYGMGIHNEPGAKRAKVQPLSETVENLLSMIFDSKLSQLKLSNGDDVAIMVNNLGGLSLLELNVIANEIFEQLSHDSKIKLSIRRSLVGIFMTSLDGPGFSVTILKLDNEVLALLDAPTDAPAWPKTLGNQNLSVEERISQQDMPKIEVDVEGDQPVDRKQLERILHSIAEQVRKDEPTITKLDTIVGDGDCGETLVKGVTALVEAFDSGKISTTSLPAAIQAIAETVELSTGGTSGAIYGIFLNALANTLRSTSTISSALSGALEELYKFTIAREGHRTLMDALIPFVQIYEKDSNLNNAVKAARDGAEKTKTMEAVLGRASYVGSDVFEKEGGVTDPGALGVVSILTGIQIALAR